MRQREITFFLAGFLLCSALAGGVDAGARRQAVEDGAVRVRQAAELEHAEYHKGFSIGGFPIVNYNSDNGLGLGAGIAMFDYGDGVEPYRHAFYVSGFVTTRWVQNHAVDWYAPNLGGTELDWRLKLQFRRQIDTPYFGIGNTTDYDRGLANPGSDRFVTKRYYQYIHTTPSALLQLRHPIAGDLSVLTGYSFRYNIHETYENSLLETEKPRGWDGGIASMVHLGLVYDTRDRVTDTRSGHWIELIARASPRFLGSSSDFFGVTLADHHYVNPIGDLVLANRLLIDVLWGAVPLSEMFRFGDSAATDGLGGAWSLRGLHAHRFIGKIKVVANPEVRYRFLTWRWWGARFDLGAIAFFDVGRVWRDVAEDGPFGKFHWGAGGGFRLVWNQNFLARFEVGGSVEGYGIYIEIFAPY